MDEIENIIEELEKVLKAYRQSLKDTEDKPGETAKQYAKEAALDTKLKLNIKQGLNSLKNLEAELSTENRKIVLGKWQALKEEYDGLIRHNLTD